MKKELVLAIMFTMGFSGCNGSDQIVLDPPSVVVVNKKPHEIVAKLSLPAMPIEYECVPVKVSLVDKESGAAASFSDETKVSFNSDNILVQFFLNCGDDSEVITSLNFPKNKSEMTAYVLARTPSEVKLKSKVGSYLLDSHSDFEISATFLNQLKSIEIVEGDGMNIVQNQMSEGLLRVKVLNEDGSPANGAEVIFSSNDGAGFALGSFLPITTSTNAEGVAETYVWAPGAPVGISSVSFQVFGVVSAKTETQATFNLTAVLPSLD